MLVAAPLSAPLQALAAIDAGPRGAAGVDGARTKTLAGCADCSATGLVPERSGSLASFKSATLLAVAWTG